MTSREQGKRRAVAVTACLAVTAAAATAGFGLAARDATRSARDTSSATSAGSSSASTSDDDSSTSGDDDSQSSTSNNSGQVTSVLPSGGSAQASTGGS